MMAACVMSSCSDDILPNKLGIDYDKSLKINVGGVATDDIDVEALPTRAQGDETDEVQREKAEKLDWLKGALRSGLDITYSNLANSVHNLENEEVAILKWTGERNEPKDIGIYTFKYKASVKSDVDAVWYDNGEHYFEGQYVPKEIRSKNDEAIMTDALTTDQHDASDYTYSTDADGKETTKGTIGNYTLLSHYIGMPPNWTTSATIEQILLPFKHRLARVIAYVLIDDELHATLEGYKVDENNQPTQEEDPSNTNFRFCNVKVLDKVSEADKVIHDANTTNLTPKWTEARKVVPHFMEEFNCSYNAKKELVAEDDDAKNNFIAYTRIRDNKKIYPRDGQLWIDAHNAYREAAKLAEGSTAPVADNQISNAEKSGFTRQMYKRVPIYDIIVRPTYTANSMVMYDEEGYYNSDKTPNDQIITNLAKEKNSIEFEMTLSTGLVYKKKFEFDLNANQQTVVYLTIDREGIDYDDSASELWIANNTTDGYYGVDNALGHNMSIVGSSWQRAVRFGTAPVNNVTDGNFYQDETAGDNSGQYFTSATKWTEEFAKAHADGERHGDYFILDNDIEIDATLLPKNFVFTGHLDGRGHTIKLINTTGQNSYKAAETSEDLYIKNGSVYTQYTIPTLYTRVLKDKEGEEDDDEYEYSVIPEKSLTLDMLKNGEYFTGENGVEFTCPALYQISHTTSSNLFRGLNAIYTTAQEDNPSISTWEANVHKEKYNDSHYWVPVAGYRAELMNVKLEGGTFFPTDAIFTGAELTKDGATVSGYITNCWEIINETEKKEVSNIVPIPNFTPIQ